MNKITVAELLSQCGLTWYGLYKRGAGSKSMCRDWVIEKHLPSTRSAARIVRSLGLPDHYRLILRTRNSWENSPRVTWGTHVRRALEARTNAATADRLEAGGTWCVSCHQKIPHSRMNAGEVQAIAL
jgi:hypothetical protein